MDESTVEVNEKVESGPKQRIVPPSIMTVKSTMKKSMFETFKTAKP